MQPSSSTRATIVKATFFFCHYYIVWESNNADEARGQSWSESLKSRWISGGSCGYTSGTKRKHFAALSSPRPCWRWLQLQPSCGSPQCYHSKKMSIDASLCIDVFTTEEFFGCRNLRALVRASRTIWWNWNGTEHNNKHENMIWYVIIWCHKINYPDSKVHGAYMGHTWGRQVRPRWAPCWPHEPCYQGSFVCVPQTTNPIN